LPSGDTAGENGEIAVTEFHQAGRRARRQAVIGIAQHQAGRSAGDESVDPQLETAQWQVAGEEQVTATESTFLAHVEESQLGAVIEHRLQR
jgi:hypothetical protein